MLVILKDKTVNLDVCSSLEYSVKDYNKSEGRVLAHYNDSTVYKLFIGSREEALKKYNEIRTAWINNDRVFMIN